MKFIKDKRNIILVSFCAALMAIIYFYYVGLAGRASARMPVKTSSATPQLSTPQSAAAVPSGEKPVLKVYITGAVKSPGVYEVHEGSRIVDVLTCAGGETEDADLVAINLAEYVKDAGKIIVPQKKQAGATATPVESGQKSAEINASEIHDTRININTADVSAFEKLPGIGETISKAIVEYRTRNGGFTDINDLKKVERIGDKTFDRIKDLITVN